MKAMAVQKKFRLGNKFRRIINLSSGSYHHNFTRRKRVASKNKIPFIKIILENESRKTHWLNRLQNLLIAMRVLPNLILTTDYLISSRNKIMKNTRKTNIMKV